MAYFLSPGLTSPLKLLALITMHLDPAPRIASPSMASYPFKSAMIPIVQKPSWRNWEQCLIKARNQGNVLSGEARVSIRNHNAREDRDINELAWHSAFLERIWRETFAVCVRLTRQ
jgi:hypothetical protein